MKKEAKTRLEKLLKNDFVTEKEYYKDLKKKRPDLFLPERRNDTEVILAKHLVQRRLELQMTQEEVSKKADVGFVTYQRMEMAKKSCNPRLKNIERVAKALRVQVEDLFCTHQHA